MKKTFNCPLTLILTWIFYWGVFAPSRAADIKAVVKGNEKLSEKEMVRKGKTAYMAKCISCHSIDPRKNGSLGPALAGSSLELITLRVLEAKYPKGYIPKRKTKLMKPLPGLKDSIVYIHAFVNSTP